MSQPLTLTLEERDGHALTLLKNMDAFLHSVVKLPVRIAEDPLTAVAVGAGKALDDLKILKRLEKG